MKALATSWLCAVLLCACGTTSREQGDTTALPTAQGSAGTVYQSEHGIQPGVAARMAQRPQELPAFTLERVSTAVPWPRGIALLDDTGMLAIVARGRHRNYGGPAADVQDREATIYEVDPSVREPYVAGQPASERVAENARVLAEPDPGVVHLYDRSLPPLDNWLMQRPFCTMVYDAPSKNLVFCAYSGVDLSGKGTTFRKNATDALLRYDRRSARWGIVEQHRSDVVPREEQGEWISNVYYPHHDPRVNPPPHGLLNGPNGCAVAGHWLYAVGKDNHALARYDLRPIREDPLAGPPPGELVLGEHVDVKVEGKLQRIALQGHSAVTAHDGWLYLGTRTSSVIVRFPIDSDGALVQPIVGELIAEFEPYSTETKRSANLWEMVANADGELFVSTSSTGRVWRFRPDPKAVFDGNDQRQDAPTPNRPYIDIRALTGNDKATVSNMLVMPDGSLYFCMTMPDPHQELAGAILRAVEARS